MVKNHIYTDELQTCQRCGLTAKEIYLWNDGSVSHIDEMACLCAILDEFEDVLTRKVKENE